MGNYFKGNLGAMLKDIIIVGNQSSRLFRGNTVIKQQAIIYWITKVHFVKAPRVAKLTQLYSQVTQKVKGLADSQFKVEKKHFS